MHLEWPIRSTRKVIPIINERKWSVSELVNHEYFKTNKNMKWSIELVGNKLRTIKEGCILFSLYFSFPFFFYSVTEARELLLGSVLKK